MADRVLVPHTRAARAVSRQVGIPVDGWPGAYIPNFQDWDPGDIVLVRREANLRGLLLSAVQGASFRRSSRAGSLWTHAALYIGNDQIVECIDGRGVVQSSIWKYCRHRSVCVRRLNEPWTPDDGLAAAVGAVKDAVEAWAYSRKEVLRSKLIPATEPTWSELYCSTYVGLRIERSTGFSIYGSPEHLPLHPASIAEHEDLRDVGVEWQHLP